MSNDKKSTTIIKPSIYFKAGETKVFLLVKTVVDNQWNLPEFKFNLENNSFYQNQTEALRQVYKLLEEHFAIARKEVKSLSIQPDKMNSKHNFLPIIDIEINEEAVIVLSNNYDDYTWGDWQEAE